LLETVAVTPPSDARGSYVLLYPSSGQTPKKVSAFCDFIVDWFKRYSL
jgi:DNA-binding transcriptional LysR family regulator